MPASSVWTAVPDGEYNEQTTEIAKQKVTLYSDRDGERWAYTIDDGSPFDLEATEVYGARREVERAMRD